MWFLSGMKFWHRVAAVFSVILVSLVLYLNLSEENAQTELLAQHRRMLQNQRFKDFGKSSDLEMCKAFDSEHKHHANISTIDLYYETQFNIKSNGDWELPLPTVDYKKSGSLPRLNVILMPHSHNDPGWQKTVTEYYTDQTKHILTNMVNKLTEHPNMTFIWAETVFFSMWWNELEDDVKVHVRRLVRRGQLEIALGGWVMPDEASTHYVSVVDQLVEGHQWLWENVGVRPENSWSIDPFGYSGTLPYLWHKAGMSNMVVQRVHQAIKGSLSKMEALEFYWRQMWDAKGSTDILCHVMPFMLYNIKFTCGPNPFTCLHFDFRHIENEYSESRAVPIIEQNVAEEALLLHNQYRAKAFFYKHNTILVPIGDDFRYDQEVEWDQQYYNYEKLMKYMNEKPEWNVNVKWGTLKDYFRISKEDLGTRARGNPALGYPVLSGDFFPYSDRDSAYWTGYYTTRPFDKIFSRDLQATIQAADILNTLTFAFYKKWELNPSNLFLQCSSFLKQAHRSLGLFQHHDAITGTSKEFVVTDYEEYLLRAYNKSQDVIKMTMQSLLSKGKVESPIVFKPETIRRTFNSPPIRQVIPVHASGTNIVFFNPLPQHTKHMVHLLVDKSRVDVLSASKEIIPNQISPVWDQMELASVFKHKFELTFLVEIGPFSLAPYILYNKKEMPKTSYTSLVTVHNVKKVDLPPPLRFPWKAPSNSEDEMFTIKNDFIELTFGSKTGSLISLKQLSSGQITDLNLSLQYYVSQGSGAYLFYPQGPANNLFTNVPAIRVSEGPLMTYVEVAFSPSFKQHITLYHHPLQLTTAVFIETEINISHLVDKEVIMRFDTNIRNPDLTFFTDQNGFQFIRRKTNKFQKTDANYYPITTGIFLEDQSTRLTLLTGQPHGAAALEMGQFEVMLDRQLVYDDQRGMGEGVRDVKTITNKFVLLVESRNAAGTKATKSHFGLLSLQAQHLQDKLLQPLLTYYTTVDTDIFYRKMDPVSKPLPCDVAAVSIRSLANNNLKYNGTSVILHRRGYDCGFSSEDLTCSASYPSLSMGELFDDLSFTNLRETSLTHTLDKRRVKPDEELKLRPMELTAYHLHF